MQKIKKMWSGFSEWVMEHKKTSIALVVIVLAIIYFIATRGSAPANVVTDTVVRRELRSTVLATGDVTSTTDLDLSFASSGTTSSVKVKVGDVVKQGDVLATLSNQSQYGAVTQAQGSVKSAQAALDKLIQGATNEEVAVAQTALSSAQVSLANTKLQQATLVSNAKSAMLNAGLQIKPAPGSSSTTPLYTPTLSGTYIGSIQGQYTITTHGGAGAYFTYGGIGSGTASSNTTTAVPLGTLGLFLTFPSGFSSMQDMQWVVNIPNTESASYLTALNAYNTALDSQTSAIATAQANVDTAQANLNLKKAAARSADIEAAQANVLGAQGQLQTAQAAYNNTIITAPADGTITAVDIKVGELATAQKEVLVLQDVSHLYLEANINEADITSVSLNQPVDVTFDAFGPDKKYTALVSHIDPASTVVSGVVNYKIKAEIQGDITGVLPGMTANMTIVTKDKQSVLVVPTRAIIDGTNGKVVRVITDAKKKTFTETPVTLGIQGDDGTEILSGLSEGQTIVVLSNATPATAK